MFNYQIGTVMGSDGFRPASRQTWISPSCKEFMCDSFRRLERTEEAVPVSKILHTIIEASSTILDLTFVQPSCKEF
jgi:hypothetical protein